MGLKFNAQVESARLRFGLFTNDVDGLTKSVQAIDMKSAFNFGDLSDAAALFGNNGVQNIPKTLQAAANAAAASGKGTEGFKSIAIALSQIAAKGRLSQEEINQLNEAGAPGAQRDHRRALQAHRQATAEPRRAGPRRQGSDPGAHRRVDQREDGQGRRGADQDARRPVDAAHRQHAEARRRRDSRPRVRARARRAPGREPRRRGDHRDLRRQGPHERAEARPRPHRHPPRARPGLGGHQARHRPGRHPRQARRRRRRRHPQDPRRHGRHRPQGREGVRRRVAALRPRSAAHHRPVPRQQAPQERLRQGPLLRRHRRRQGRRRLHAARDARRDAEEPGVGRGRQRRRARSEDSRQGHAREDGLGQRPTAARVRRAPSAAAKNSAIARVGGGLAALLAVRRRRKNAHNDYDSRGRRLRRSPPPGRRARSRRPGYGTGPVGAP
jgi:hypothetical protein